MNAAIIKQTIREAGIQPPFLFAFIVEVGFICLLIFGIGLNFEQGQLVSMKLFGGNIDETQAASSAQELAGNTANLMVAALMFLFILGSSFLYPDLLRSPLVGILLTKPVSRQELFFSKFAGPVILVLLNLVACGLIISAVLYFKSDGRYYITPPLISFSLWFEFVVIFSLCALLAMLIENSTGIAVLGIAIYYLLAPLLSQAKQGGNPLLAIIAYVLPPIGELSARTRGLVTQGELGVALMAVSLAYTSACLFLASYIFNRRDIA